MPKRTTTKPQGKAQGFRTSPEAKGIRQAAKAAELAKLQQQEKLPKHISEIPTNAKPLTEQEREAVLSIVSQGVTLTKACEIEGMPSYYRVTREVMRSSGFAEALSRARELGASAMADKVIDIADEIAPDSAAVQRNRLRMEARIKHAGWHNSRYSDRMTADEVAGVVAATIEAARARYQAKMKSEDASPAKVIEAEKVSKSKV